MPLTDISKSNKLYSIALGLALFTIFYNIAEGLVSTFFGFEDESFALFGFGLDSFIEVISGLGIAHMIVRIRRNPGSNRDRFERTALRITGTSFYLLVIGLIASGIYSIWVGHRPVTTLWGVAISLVSILVMWVLVVWKRRLGNELESAPILADANCTLVCVYMSLILLFSSGIYALTGLPYVDSLGTLGLAYFSFSEGKECFEKAKSETYCNCH